MATIDVNKLGQAFTATLSPSQYFSPEDFYQELSLRYPGFSDLAEAAFGSRVKYHFGSYNRKTGRYSCLSLNEISKKVVPTLGYLTTLPDIDGKVDVELSVSEGVITFTVENENHALVFKTVVGSVENGVFAKDDTINTKNQLLKALKHSRPTVWSPVVGDTFKVTAVSPSQSKVIYHEVSVESSYDSNVVTPYLLAMSPYKLGDVISNQDGKTLINGETRSFTPREKDWADLPSGKYRLKSYTRFDGTSKKTAKPFTIIGLVLSDDRVFKAPQNLADAITQFGDRRPLDGNWGSYPAYLIKQGKIGQIVEEPDDTPMTATTDTAYDYDIPF